MGARPRSRARLKLKAPRPYAPKPDFPPLLGGDGDPPSNAVEHGHPGISWIGFVEVDAHFGPGTTESRQGRLDHLC
eukprot:7076962-Pyramimonas_sp.AAC.1